MTQFDPTDRTIEELPDTLEEIDDLQALEAILEAEREDSNRPRARRAIHDRIAAVRSNGAGDDAATHGDASVLPSLDGANFASLRLRALVSNRPLALVALLIAATVLGGWLTYSTHVAPGTHVEERSTVLYERSATFEHRATVRAPNAVYPVGTVLAERPLYYTVLTPTLDGAFVYRYDSPHGASITVTPRLELVLHSVDRREDGVTEFWRTTRRLESGTTQQVGPGESGRASFALNVSALERQVDRVEDDLGAGVGSPEAVLVARVSEQVTIDGEPLEETRTTYRMRVDLRGGTYAVTVPDAEQTAVRSTDRVTVPNAYGPLRRAGSPLLFAVASLALIGLLGAHGLGRLPVSEDERDCLDFVMARRSSDEWITTARLPADAHHLPTVPVESLEDLVDLAIDTNNRVIEDPVREEYSVFTDRFRYTYRPPLPPRG